MSDRWGAKLEALRPAIEEFRGVGPVVVSEEKIAAYLSATAENGLDLGNRLVSLAGSLQNEPFADGWKGFCRIYEYALHKNPDDSGAMVTWQISAIACWIHEWHTPSLNERLMVANDLEAMLLSDLDRYGQNCAIAGSLGRLYYLHPQRSPKILEKALEWFRTSAAWATHEDEEGEAVVAQLYIAHCLFDLGETVAALKAYEAVDESVLVYMEDKVSIRALHEGLSSCKGRNDA